MPRIPQNLRERAGGIQNAGMTINAVATNIRCSTCVIRQLPQRFQETGRTEDRPRSEVRASRRVAKTARYIRTTYLSNRFQTATATNTHGTHNFYICPNCVASSIRWLSFGATS